MNAKKRALMAGIGCTAVILLFSVLVVLDTFVLPKASGEKAVAGPHAGTAAVPAEPGTVTLTQRSYTDDNLSVVITEYRLDDTTLYAADIRLSSLSYLKTAFAKGTFGRNYKDVTSAIAAENRAIFAVNGDFCGYRSDGYVIRNGILYRSVQRTERYDDLAIYADGTFAAIQEPDVSARALLDAGVVQLFSFGPTLVRDGEIAVTVDEEVARSKTSNPRTAIGILEPLHYLIVVSDGRTEESEGLTLYELAGFLREQGCSLAYNLDGGGSATMVFNGEIVNYPTNGNTAGERKVSDIVYIGYE